MAPDDSVDLSRRGLLKSSGGALGFSGIGFGRWGRKRRCPEATIRPGMVHYDHSGMAQCADDHPATRELQATVTESLEIQYPTVGALIDAGYVPYFDFFDAEGEAAWSHWLSPAYLGDDAIVDPERPESILVDHQWWRPIGVMFVATRDGDAIESPPAVYQSEDGDTTCLPWHAHVGLPGRYAWWKYRLAYGHVSPWGALRLPCRTPWMMHVWAYGHPESVYAHDGPPREYRGGPPAEPAGFDTDATPGEDRLDEDVLPDAVLHAAKRLF